LGQSVGVVDLEPISIVDLKEIDRRLQEYEILKTLVGEQKKIILELEASLLTEKKTNELNQREIDLQKRILDIKDMEIKVTRQAVNDMKEISDRAIKLAEVSKPKSNWQLLGLAAIVGYIINELVHK